ncbi:hypothetical protein HK096_007083, partial [Nowakowskiella sp. JEL0078]
MMEDTSPVIVEVIKNLHSVSPTVFYNAGIKVHDLSDKFEHKHPAMPPYFKQRFRNSVNKVESKSYAIGQQLVLVEIETKKLHQEINMLFRDIEEFLKAKMDGDKYFNTEEQDSALSHATKLLKILGETSMNFREFEHVIDEMGKVRNEADEKINELYPWSVWLPFRNGYLKDETNYLLKQLDDAHRVISEVTPSLMNLHKKFQNVRSSLKIDSNEIPGPISLERSLMIIRNAKNEIGRHCLPIAANSIPINTVTDGVLSSNSAIKEVVRNLKSISPEVFFDTRMKIHIQKDRFELKHRDMSYSFKQQFRKTVDIFESKLYIVGDELTTVKSDSNRLHRKVIRFYQDVEEFLKKKTTGDKYFDHEDFLMSDFTQKRASFFLQRLESIISIITDLSKKTGDVAININYLGQAADEAGNIRNDAEQYIDKLNPWGKLIPYWKDYLKSETGVLLVQIERTHKVISEVDPALKYLRNILAEFRSSLKIESNEIPGPISLERSLNSIRNAIAEL